MGVVTWDLSLIQLHWMGMSIGAGASVSTPLFKKNYDDEDWLRCLELVAFFCGFQLCLTIPLWKEPSDEPAEG